MKDKQIDPCQNKDCIKYHEEYGRYDGTNCSQDILKTTKLRCPKYLSKPKESAWELFRRLKNQYGDKFLDSLFNNFVKDTGLIEVEDETYLLYHLNTDEQEAIKVLKEIQKELSI